MFKDDVRNLPASSDGHEQKIVCFPTSFGRVCWDANEKLDKRSMSTRIKEAKKARIERAARWFYEDNSYAIQTFGGWDNIGKGRRVKGKISPWPNKLYYIEKAQKLLQVIDDAR